MDSISGHVMNLANSIIGVSILAMPYCFKQCGIVLSIMMLLISSAISRLACHFLLKSAIVSRRKTFEFLAFHIFGSMGKLAIEIGMIGFLLGTCIAFFVVMGDLAPEIISEMTGASTTNTMRTSILMALALFCVLPLGLLRNVDSLNGVSRATIGFYCCLVLKVVFETTPHIFAGDWYKTVNIWRPEGILQCLPIFSMALFCQTQLFEIYQAVPNATLDKMNNLVRIAVNICTSVYILVGTFGYIAFANKTFTGNILLSFSPSFMTDVMKIGFVLSVAFSFPLVIFPCRASLYSLFYKEGYLLHEGVSNYIPEGKFKGLTMIIVFISLIVGILIPNIELVLGLVGSTIGVMICVLFPVTCFICISPKNTNERILAQLMLMVGIFVMVLGTYKNLHSLDNIEPNVVTITSLRGFDQPKSNIQVEINANKISNTKKIEIKTNVILKSTEDNQLKEVRHEPPQPFEPIEDQDKDKKKRDEPQSDVKVKKKVDMNSPEVAVTPQSPVKSISIGPHKPIKNEEVDIEAIRKEDKEVEQQEKERVMEEDKNHQILIDTIQKQHEVQKEVLEQQKKLIEVIQNQQKQKENEEVHKVKEEKMKAVKEIEDIAKKAIEKISGKDNNQIVKDFEEEIKKIEETEVQLAVTKGEQSSNQVVVPQTEILTNLRKPGNENIVKNENPLIQLLEKEKRQGDKEVNNQPTVLKNKLSDNKFESNLTQNHNNAVDAPTTISNQTKNVGSDIILEKKVFPIPDNLNLFNKTILQEPDNKSAPLMLKLGNVHVKISDDQDPQKLLPLPIAISTNLKQAEPKNLLAINTKILKNKSSDAEAQAMRRDILNDS